MMDRRKLYNLLAEEISKDPSLLGTALEGLAQAVQSLADQHRGVRGFAKMVKYLDNLDLLLQDEKDDADALMPERS